jgi:long-chain-fatty-acid--[acyl-carrier-protein] ligase
MLANLVGAYQATLIGGTPTLLAALVGCASEHQLDTLRLAVTGGEACPDQVHDALASRCRNARILEGYGITECSPIVSINTLEADKPGTIGRVLPSLDHALLDLESGKRTAPGRPGLLLVRGPSVFSGYLGGDGTSPFVELDGYQWFNTGDVVAEDEDGFLCFHGRKRRFVKRAGEMISLPAIEAVLASHFDSAATDGPVLAVTACGDDTSTELVLFTTLPLDRQEVNRRLRDAGMSPLHSIHRIVKIAAIPVLGSGKTDYRALHDLS